GEQEKLVEFDKNSVKVNGESYYFVAVPPHIDLRQDGVVTTNLLNETDQNQTVNVTWKTYWWDAQKAENLLDTKTEIVNLYKGETKNLSYVVTDKSYSVYLVVAEVEYKDTKSILGTRFVRDGINNQRINFPAITSFPLIAGTSTSIFSCLHSTATDEKNGSLLLKLEDPNGNIIHSYQFSGTITGDMMGVKDDFIPKKNYDKFSLVAELSQNGKVVDSVKMDYDCNNIDPAKCFPPTKINSPVLISLVVLLFITFILFFIFEKRKHKIFTVLLIITLIIIGFFYLFRSQKVFGQTPIYDGSGGGSIVWNYVIPDYLYANAAGDSQNMSYMENAIGYYVAVNQKANISVTYKVTASKLSGSQLSPGNVVRFTFSIPSSTDLSWTGTGRSNDTPPGHWVTDSSSVTPANSCIVADKMGQNQITKTYHVALNVSSPAKSLINTAGLSCGSMTAGGYIDCTVSTTTVSTVINPKFSFGATQGRYYLSWKIGTYCDINPIPLSHSNDVPTDISANADCVGLSCYATGSDLSNSKFILNVPAQTIPYTYTVVPLVVANNPPLPPTMTGPTTGTTSTSYNFIASSTDPDGDQIRYGFDWNKDGTVDTWAPSSGYVNSGASQTGSKTWISIGTQTFQVLSQDSKNATSTWKQYSITISNPQVGACGSSNGISTTTTPTTNLCSIGNPSSVTLSGNTFNWTCTQDSTASCSATKISPCVPNYTCNAQNTGYINSCSGATTICSNGLICSQGGCTNATNVDGTKVGTIILQRFVSSPNTINLNGTCNFTWTLSQYDSASFCDVYDSNNNLIQSSPSPITKTGTVSKTRVTKETTYHIVCGEKVINPDGSVTITKIPAKYTTCNINPSFNEKN
ncbi:MAG: hypothetical protein WCF92_01435, partial [bacterium]